MKKHIIESPQPVDPSKYYNVGFKNIGHGNPIADKINPSLLSDIETAAKNANIDVKITTAVSGHKEGTRHEKGLAVDIAIINGYGWKSYDDAVQKNIYNGMWNFVQNLKRMGYVENQESGNDKSVLWFGFDGHNNHIHISRNSDEYGERTSDQTTTVSTTDTTTGETPITTTTTTLSDLSLGFLDPYLKGLEGVRKQMSQKESVSNDENLLTEIQKIKKIMKI